MTIKETINAFDIEGITELSLITGRSKRTLYEWYYQQKQFFLIVCAGAKVHKEQQK